MLQDHRTDDVVNGFLVALGVSGIFILILCFMLSPAIRINKAKTNTRHNASTVLHATKDRNRENCKCVQNGKVANGAPPSENETSVSFHPSPHSVPNGDTGLNEGDYNACEICNGTVQIFSPEDQRSVGHTQDCEDTKAWRNVMVVAAIFCLVFNIIPHVVSSLYNNKFIRLSDYFLNLQKNVKLCFFQSCYKAVASNMSPGSVRIG